MIIINMTSSKSKDNDTKKLSKAHKKALSESHKGLKYPNRKSPKLFTQEHLQKLSKARKKWWSSLDENQRKVSEASRKKMSEAHKKTYENGRIPSFKDKPLSDSHKQSISNSLKEYWSTHEHPSKGRTITQQHKDILRKANIGRKLTQEQIAKRTATLKAKIKKRTSERRSQSHKKYYETHDVWNKGIPHSEETRKRMSEGMKRYWNNKQGNGNRRTS